MNINDNLTQKIYQFTNSVSVDPYFYWVTFIKYKKQIIGFAFLISLLVLFISKSIEPRYESKAKIIIDSNLNKIIDIEQVYTEGDGLINRKNHLNTQIEILKSSEIISRLFKREGFLKKINEFDQNGSYGIINKISNYFFKKELANESFIASSINKNIIIKNIWDSDVLELSFISNNAELSQFILNSIIETYLEYDIDQKISITTYANKKIKDRLNVLLENLQISEKKLQDYKEQNQLIDLGDIKNLKSEEIKSLSSRILKAEKELQELQNDLQQIKLAEGDIEDLMNLKKIKDQKEVQTIKSDLDSNSKTIDSLRLVYTDNHPKVAKAIKTEENLNNKLDEIVNENITSYAYEMANLQNFISLSEAELEKARNELQELEVNEIEMQKYVRDVDLNKRVYESFLERLKETTEVKELQTPGGKILDYPSINLIPVSPNVKLNTIISFLTTSILLYLLITYYETFRKSITDPSTLETNGFNMLNIIPKLKEKKGYHIPINFLEKTSDKFSESIKILQTLLQSKYKSAKVFLITSPCFRRRKNYYFT